MVDENELELGGNEVDGTVVEGTEIDGGGVVEVPRPGAVPNVLAETLDGVPNVLDGVPNVLDCVPNMLDGAGLVPGVLPRPGVFEPIPGELGAAPGEPT